MINPEGIPIMPAMRVEKKLTLRDTITIFRSSWSRLKISMMADLMLSMKNGMA